MNEQKAKLKVNKIFVQSVSLYHVTSLSLLWEPKCNYFSGDLSYKPISVQSLKV